MQRRLPSKPQEATKAVWCIEKIIQLVSHFNWDKNSKFSQDFNLAEAPASREAIKLKPIEEEELEFLR